MNYSLPITIPHNHPRTFESLPLGDPNDIDHFIAAEHLFDLDGLLKVLTSPLHLVSHATAIHLDLHDVGTLLMKALDQTQLWGENNVKQ